MFRLRNKPNLCLRFLHIPSYRNFQSALSQGRRSHPVPGLLSASCCKNCKFFYNRVRGCKWIFSRFVYWVLKGLFPKTSFLLNISWNPFLYRDEIFLRSLNEQFKISSAVIYRMLLMLILTGRF